MQFAADLHIHSRYSRATAKNLDLENLNLWGQLKGLRVVATGDFTHPGWSAELREKLEEAEEGLFALKQAYAEATDPEAPSSCRSPVRFLLTAEISSIYKKDGKTRKVHSLVLAPDFDTISRINQALDKIGNLNSDGRPILGLDPKDLLDIVLEASEEAYLIPAHIWTPWFSVLGSRSGFDSIEACFEDLTPHIFALETGLSSDPSMNWCLSSLDGFALVSNSDAHSPSKLAREANRFDTELSFGAIKEALRTGTGFQGTIEFFPEEGKYHFDGHRKCQMRMHPKETIASDGKCPECGKPVTVGVLHRVEQLADREEGHRPEGSKPYLSLLSLADILSEVLGVGPTSKKVQRNYRALLEKLGPELDILIHCDLSQIEREGSSILAEGIKRVRDAKVKIAAGYDGEFGRVHLFTEEERARLSGQRLLPQLPVPEAEGDKSSRRRVGKTVERPPVERSLFSPEVLDPEGARSLNVLNPAQREAVLHQRGPLMIVAGPGTGKTRTLTHRIAHMIIQGIARSEEALAITFTQKAAHEIGLRLDDLLLDPVKRQSVLVTTFHGLCYRILKEEAGHGGFPPAFTLYTEAEKVFLVRSIVDELDTGLRGTQARDILQSISKAKQELISPTEVLRDDERLGRIYDRYERELEALNALDLDDLLVQVVALFEKDDEVLSRYRKRFPYVFVDEHQDVNYAQYRIIRLLSPKGDGLCVIGDPDQAIYGFRGADRTYFLRFREDYKDASVILLEQNYRSTETVLKAAKQVIGAASELPSMDLRSGIQGDPKVITCELSDDADEAEFVVNEIDRLVGGMDHRAIDAHRDSDLFESEERGFGDFAVLYRTHAVGSAFEEAFAQRGIPIQRMGDRSLDQQDGVREVLACLGLFLAQKSDASVLQMLLQFPEPRLQRETIQGLLRRCEEEGWSLVRGLEDPPDPPNTDRKSKENLRALGRRITTFVESAEHLSVTDKIRHAVEHFQIEALLADRTHDEAVWESRHAWLLQEASVFASDLEGFLASTALRSAVDLHDERAQKVTLMTLHAAKGLEFPVVFIAGCEDGLIPYARASREGDVNEERRLFYVGITRAMDRLYLCHAKARRLFGALRQCSPSPFLDDIEDGIKDQRSPTGGFGKGKRSGQKQLSLF